jgi:hypothetical protein
VSGLELSLRIGQRVRHRDYKGQRVTGVVRGIAVEGDNDALMVDLVLDAPIVIPASDDYREISIYRQHVPAHELSAFDDRDELVAALLEALRDTTAKLSACRLVVSDPIARAEMTESVNAANAAAAKAQGKS